MKKKQQSKSLLQRNLKSTLSFTLIELLVVIAIIAILASMLLPALKNVRIQAKTVNCAGNMRQLQFYITMYNETFKDYVMPAVQCSARSDRNGRKTNFFQADSYFCNSIRPVSVNTDDVDNPKVMRCPGVPKGARFHYSADSTQNPMDYASMIINNSVSYDATSADAAARAYKIHHYRLPEKIPYMTDGLGSTVWTGWQSSGKTYRAFSPIVKGDSSWQRLDYTRHTSKKLNVLTLAGNIVSCRDMPKTGNAGETDTHSVLK